MASRSPRLLTLLTLADKSGWLIGLVCTGLFWTVLGASAQALDMRVVIKEGASQVNIGSSTNATVRDAAGKPIGELQGMNGFAAQSGGQGLSLDKWTGRLLTIEPTGGGVVWIGNNWYRGKAVLLATGSGVTVVNYVDLEQYLYSVIGGEMGARFPQEALKSQAVAARTYALYQRQKPASGYYDVGDTTRWQVYRGVSDESGATQAAVNATTAQVLTYKGQIIEAAFHACSGGHTENVEDVWVQNLPYLRAVPDFDLSVSPALAKDCQWSTTFTRSQISSRITGVGLVRSIEGVESTKTAGGRYRKMMVIGDQGKREFKAESLRSALGLKSDKFSVRAELGKVASANAPKVEPVSFIVTGGGYGHGLGLSQWGAYALAQQNYNYASILNHYYQNTNLAKMQEQP
jgi:stage II sporulation protein D